MDLLIRPAIVDDCGIIATLNEYGQEPHVAARPDVFKPTSHAELEAWFRALLNAPTTRAWIARLGGEPVGYVVAIVRTTEENPFCVARRWLELDQIAVVAAYRGRGIARALTEQVMALARAEGFRSVELGSWAFNERAHAVFAKLGFSVSRLRFEQIVE
jgi:ribosomal protein S18 acetylase RimI-like enzyme